MKLKMFTDGGARGNPGPAAIGVLVCDENGKPLIEHGETIGEATNNVAEYRALLKGLELVQDYAAKQNNGSSELDLACFLDSELVVRQLTGRYKVKNYNMQKLFDEVHAVKTNFKIIRFTHLPREADGMRRADQLVNYALDKR